MMPIITQIDLNYLNGIEYGVSLPEINDSAGECAVKDQTARMDSLIFHYTLNKR